MKVDLNSKLYKSQLK